MSWYTMESWICSINVCVYCIYTICIYTYIHIQGVAVYIKLSRCTDACGWKSWSDSWDLIFIGIIFFSHQCDLIFMGIIFFLSNLILSSKGSYFFSPIWFDLHRDHIFFSPIWFDVIRSLWGSYFPPPKKVPYMEL